MNPNTAPDESRNWARLAYGSSIAGAGFCAIAIANHAYIHNEALGTASNVIIVASFIGAVIGARHVNSSEMNRSDD